MLLLLTPALRGVHDRRDHEQTGLGEHRTQADLDGDERSVLAASHQFASRRHPACERHRDEAAAVRRVLRALNRFGQQQVDGLSEELVPLVAKQPLELEIGERNPAIGTGDQHPALQTLDGQLEQVPGPGSGPFEWKR